MKMLFNYFVYKTKAISMNNNPLEANFYTIIVC